MLPDEDDWALGVDDAESTELGDDGDWALSVDDADSTELAEDQDSAPDADDAGSTVSSISDVHAYRKRYGRSDNSSIIADAQIWSVPE